VKLHFVEIEKHCPVVYESQTWAANSSNNKVIKPQQNIYSIQTPSLHNCSNRIANYRVRPTGIVLGNITSFYPQILRLLFHIFLNLCDILIPSLILVILAHMNILHNVQNYLLVTRTYECNNNEPGQPL